MKIKLVVHGDKLVAFTEMPPFNPPPRGVLWGQRTFFLREGEQEGDSKGNLMLIYEEDFMWADPSQFRIRTPVDG